MAKKREFNVETITIDAQPAVNAIKKLDGTLGSLRSTIKGVKQERQDALLANNLELYGKLTKKLEDLGAQYKNLRALQRNIVTEVKNINDVLANMSNATYNELIQLQGQLQRAIKSAKPNTDDYKNLENTLRDVNARVEELKSTWKGLSEEAEKAAEAQRQAVANEPLKHSVDQIKEAIKQTEKLRDTKPVDSASYKQYNNELNKLKETLKEAEKPIKKTVLSSEELKKIINNLPTAPFEKLKLASEALEEELHKLAPDTEEFIVKSSELRIVNGQIAELNDKWKDHDGAILSTIKRLTAYVAVYGSFNFILGKLKGWANDMLKLSDSMADVQKTTGLAHKQLRLLSKDIDSIDTRSTQEQMHQLAATAGQIGMRSREDILGFVKAADQLTVALNELGDEGVQSLAKLATLTGEVQRMGVEKSLLAIGSSINELSASSAAAAGPIADFMRRTGGLANMAKLSSADLAALGATADALGQPIETAATAMNKFITTLVMNTDDVAYALNLDKEAMKQLIQEGRTMEAITDVLAAVNAKGDEGALAGIFKELGSEGARMTQTMMALSENVKFLKAQVRTSREAFDEATSATEEYNVKNETAAAVVERIGNTLREFFVSADYTQGLTNLLNKLHDFIKLLISASEEAVKFRAALGAILTVKFLWSPTLGVVKFFANLITKTKTATVGLIGLRKAWVALKTVMTASNVITLVLTGVAAAFIAVKNATIGLDKESKRLAESLADLKEQEEGEKRRLNELYEATQKVGLTSKERAEVIEVFNETYSGYLGYLVSETADVEELTRAYNLLNAQLELRYAKMLEAEHMKGALETYGREVRNINVELTKGLEPASDQFGISQKLLLEGLTKGAKEFAAKRELLLVEGKDKNVQEFRDYVQTVDELRSINDNSLYYILKHNAKYINQLIVAEMDLLDARKRAEEEGALVTKEAEDRVKSARKSSMDGMQAEVEGYSKNLDAIKKMNKEEVEDVIDKGNTVLSYLQEQANEKIKIAEKERDEAIKGLPTSDKRTLWDENEYKKAVEQFNKLKDAAEAPLFAFQAELDKIQKIYAGDAWNKALNIQKLREAYGNLQNIKTASVDNLVETYKSLEDAGKRYTNVTEFNSLFGMNAQTIDEMHAFFKNYARQVKDRLKELGYTTAGNYDWSSEAGKKKKNQIKQEYEAALSALEAYYKEEETIIRRNGMANNLTETEIEHQLLENEEAFFKDRQELRKRMLAEDNVFDTSKFIGKITGTDYFKGKNLDLLAKQMKDIGVAMTDGIRLGLAEDMNAVEKQAWKVKQKTLEIISDREWHAKVDREMLASFEGIGAFWGKEAERTETEGKRVLAEMKKVSQYVYSEDEKSFRKILEQNEVFGDMFDGLTKEQQEAFIILLGDFHDKVIEADKKFADERKRVYNQAWKDSGFQEQYDAAKESIDEATATLDWFEGNGAIAKQRTYLDAKTELINAEVALESAAHAQRVAIMEKTGATQQMRMEEERNYATTMQQLGQQMLENYKARFEHMAEIHSTYGEIIGDGLVRMAYNEENAGTEMVKSILRTTVEMASQYAQRLIMQQTFGAAMQSIKAQQSAQEISAAYTTAMTEIGIEASKMAAIEAIATGEITAQSMAAPDSVMSYGAAGVARAALLTGLVAAATAGALALIDNLFPGAATAAKSESATAPKRKLTTGMHTYAEGRYPVLGNDGVVYDAQYAGSNMKTGVYRKPHFGIFAEKQPEMVIDGKTTQRLVLNYPEIYNGILELSRTGRMRTYADGNVSEFASVSAQQQMQMEEMRMTMAATAAAVAALTRRLEQPIHAEMNYFGKGGAREAEQRGSRWATRNRVK